jgi:NDP-sugar pyrophosphorylase family protein
MEKRGDLLGDEMMSALPVALRRCLTDPKWWADDLASLHMMAALSEMAVPSNCDGYRRVDNAPSPRWDWQGHALVHESSLVHSGVNLFGPVVVGPDCEVGPNASLFGPTVVEGHSYIGPCVEVRRCLLLAHAEVAHMSFLGHSVIGRHVSLGAFFCSAVRNLERGTVHVVRTTVMPGRRVTETPFTLPNSVIVKNC